MLLVLYCIAIVVASLLGGWLPLFTHMTHRRMQFTMSFVSGLMLGIALLHLIPHAVGEAGSVDAVAMAATAGLLLTFAMIRIFHVHQHAHEDAAHELGVCDNPDHRHGSLHVEQPMLPVIAAHSHSPPAAHTHHASWLGLFLGLGLHTFFDGLALAASVVAGTHESTGTLVGIGTFLAVVLHKPLDSLSITCVMKASHWSAAAINSANVAFALMCPLGALLFCLGVRQVGAYEQLLLGCALGFAAGIFLCISLADILPEVQFHQHDRWGLSIALCLGVLLAFLVGFIEPEHLHHDVVNPSSTPAVHSHSAHEHGH